MISPSRRFLNIFLFRKISAERSAANLDREFPVAFACSAQCSQRDETLSKRRDVCLGTAVAVPAPVRPLSSHQTLGQSLRSLIEQAQLENCVEGVSFHGSMNSRLSLTLLIGPV